MKIVFSLILLILIIAGMFMLDTYRDAGEFKDIEPHFDGEIRKISGVIGAEDITINPETGVAYLSCDDRRATLRGEPVQGTIYAYDLKSENPALVNLTRGFSRPFHPHGISLYVGRIGQAELFVINHDADTTRIELFDVTPDSLIFRESFVDGSIHSANDILAVGPRQFYVTNDHGYTSALGRTFEEYFRLPKANVVYFDDVEFIIVATGLQYANGINMSPDGSRVYVAETTGFGINVYERDPEFGELKLLQSIDLNTGVDNIEVDAAGNLWIGAHPKLLTFVKHSKNSSKLSPSQILKITPTGEGEYQVEEIFLSDGIHISGSSVGAVFEDDLLIGSVFDDLFLRCKMHTDE